MPSVSTFPGTGELTYSATRALWFYYVHQNQQVSGLKIRWAKTAIEADGSDCIYTHVVNSSSVEWCQTGYAAYGAGINYTWSSSMCGVGTTHSDDNCYASNPSNGCTGYEGSGLPYSWEIEYFGYIGINPNADPDGDGYTNLQEYQNGTNPWVFNSISIQEAVDQPSWVFTTGGSANWYGQNTTYSYGGDAAQSGHIVENQSTYIQTTITGPGTISFYWKVSSEQNYDFLRFYIDGGQLDSISGNVDWTPRNFTVPSGTHTLKWEYSKDYSVDSGSDAGWVDYVQFTPGGGGGPSLGEAVDNTQLSWTTDGDASWSGETTYYLTGGAAAQSGHISALQSTFLHTTVTGPTSLTFYWKVSSEYACDYLRFYIDNMPQTGISGDVDWTPQSFSLGSGAHTLSWKYSKDSSVDAGLDAGWVDFVATGQVSPTITSQPQSQTVSVGSPVNFSVSATGTLPFSYQWYKNDDQHPVGGNSSTYSIASVQSTDAGNYYVRVSNSAGSATSSMATLTVQASGSCATPPSGITAWWQAESNGTDIIGGNTATLLNGMSFASAKVNTGFSLDGYNDYAEVSSSSALNPTAGITVEAWIRQTAGQYQNMPIFSKDGIYSSRQYMLTVSDAGSFRPHVGLTSGLFYYDGNTQVQLNTWYHVAMTYDGSYLRLYVNGVLDKEQYRSGSLITTSVPLRIGGSDSGPWGNYKFQGLIDEPSVYNRALTQPEISQICGAGPAGKCPPIIDADGDGLPDAWEQQYFGNTTYNGNDDPDGDGYTNLEEYQNGTNPTVADPMAILYEPKPGSNML